MLEQDSIRCQRANEKGRHVKCRPSVVQSCPARDRLTIHVWIRWESDLSWWLLASTGELRWLHAGWLLWEAWLPRHSDWLSELLSRLLPELLTGYDITRCA